MECGEGTPQLGQKLGVVGQSEVPQEGLLQWPPLLPRPPTQAAVTHIKDTELIPQWFGFVRIISIIIIKSLLLKVAA